MSASLHGLEFPDGLFYAPGYNLWLREEVDGSLTLGLSAYGCTLYDEIFASTPKRGGRHIERSRNFDVAKFAKAVFSARSPLAGTLLASNPAAVKRPVLTNRDYYGEGWMVRLQPDDWAPARGVFLQGDAAREAFVEYMRLDGSGPQHSGVQALDF